jgi:hypothetical protein
VSDRGFPGLTGSSGTQRARGKVGLSAWELDRSGPPDAADQPTGLTLSIRAWPRATLANCTLITRRRTLQGMARVRSGRAPA